jgi:hypothetical protein
LIFFHDCATVAATDCDIGLETDLLIDLENDQVIGLGHKIGPGRDPCSCFFLPVWERASSSFCVTKNPSFSKSVGLMQDFFLQEAAAAH